jgi:hypothetical protein
MPKRVGAENVVARDFGAIVYQNEFSVTRTLSAPADNPPTTK